MLSSQEQEYIKSLIDTYFKNGYKYYLLVSRRTSYSSDDFEYFLYLSPKSISGMGSNMFHVMDGCLVKIDTSAKSNGNYDDNLVTEGFSGVVHTDVSEFVYSNCTVEYDVATESLNPDLFLRG